LVKAFLGLGSNLGNRVENIRSAVRLMSNNPDIRIIAVSSFYESAAIGYTDQPDFVNTVIEIETTLPAMELLGFVLQTENTLGRIRNQRWGPRVIDIDILIYDELTMRTDALTVPHPRMLERAFVIVPLAEIEPHLVLQNGRTAEETAACLTDQRVTRMPEVA